MMVKGCTGRKRRLSTNCVAEYLFKKIERSKTGRIQTTAFKAVVLNLFAEGSQIQNYDFIGEPH